MNIKISNEGLHKFLPIQLPYNLLNDVPRLVHSIHGTRIRAESLAPANKLPNSEMVLLSDYRINWQKFYRTLPIWMSLIATNYAYAVNANPASKGYVDQQDSILQSQITTLQQEGVTGATGPTGAAGATGPTGATGASGTLTAASWEALCPTGQSLSNSAGCMPDCTGAQSAACNTVLSTTNLLALFALPAASSNNIIAFSFTPGEVTTNGPSMTTPAPTYATYAACIATNVLGALQPQVPNYVNIGGPDPITFTYPTLLLLNGGGSGILQLYQSKSGDTGFYFSTTNTYYVICAGFSVSEPFS